MHLIASSRLIQNGVYENSTIGKGNETLQCKGGENMNILHGKTSKVITHTQENMVRPYTEKDYYF